MIYLEMTRDPVHGGGDWSFPQCVWAPTRAENGRSSAYWEKVRQIEEGDVVIHLRGKPPDACFVGHSIAAGPGFIAKGRPPQPGDWGEADQFYRADLKDYKPFEDAQNLDRVFERRRHQLTEYFRRNKAKTDSKALLFCVIQSGRLRCQNGAYLTDVDEELLTILFARRLRTLRVGGGKVAVAVETGSDLQTVEARRGQGSFAKNIKELYSQTCCFPGCDVRYQGFLVAAHIVRWADNEELRGHMGNGLCFCLMHDKAFEVGLFTLDDDLRVFVNPAQRNAEHPAWPPLLAHDRQPIKTAKQRPLKRALAEHRRRVGIDIRL